MGTADSLTGSTLRTARERQHLTQEEAATQLGVSVRAYRTWESDTPPVPHPRHRRALQTFIGALQEAVA